MLSMGCAADWKKTPPFPSRRLSSSLRTLVFYNMTKLTEWIVFAGLAFSIWITLLTDILPLKVSYKAKEVIWPMPVYALIVFGCYSLATIGYRVATFNDCEEASESLKQEIKDAREDLSRRGFKFD